MRALFIATWMISCGVAFAAPPAKVAKPKRAPAPVSETRVSKLNRELELIEKDRSPARAEKRYRAFADRLFKSNNADDIAVGAAALGNLTSLLIDVERYDEAIEIAQIGITRIRKETNPRLDPFVAQLYYNQAAAFDELGDKDQRVAQLSQILMLFEDSDNPSVVGVVAAANLDLVDDLILAGQIDEASRSLSEFQQRFLMTDILSTAGPLEFNVSCTPTSTREFAVDCIPTNRPDKRYYAMVVDKYWQKICTLKPDCKPIGASEQLLESVRHGANFH